MQGSIKTKIDKVSIYRATDTANQRTSELRMKLADFDEDAKKSERVEQSFCKHCFYIYGTRIGGAKITSRDCGICHTPQTYSSTATDPLCLPCAKKNNLCKRCGGDINMKHIRKERDYEKVSDSRTD